MVQPEDSARRDREIAELRQRLSLLSQASLRITEDLDMEIVLQGALDSARSLTAARYGVIALHDYAGVPGDFLASGMTPGEAELLWTIPGWQEHFGYLARLDGPLRVPDLLEHLRSLGLPEMRPPVEVSPQVSFLGFPLLHRGQRAGSIYLAEKEGGREFTPEDEETLGLFAAQAALAIANAHRHREEQRARPAWRPWWTPLRWEWRSSTPKPGGPPPSTARPGASWTVCGTRTSPRSNCWRC